MTAEPPITPLEDDDPRADNLANQVVIRVIAKMLIPYIFVFGFYVVAHGEIGPGGGFQGGVILAAGYILYALIFGRDAGLRVLPPRWVDRAMAAGVLFYAGIGVLGFFRGAAFLDYRALGSHFEHAEPMGMALVEIGVAITVSAVMVTIFNMITEPRQR